MAGAAAAQEPRRGLQLVVLDGGDEGVGRPRGALDRDVVGFGQELEAVHAPGDRCDLDRGVAVRVCCQLVPPSNDLGSLPALSGSGIGGEQRCQRGGVPQPRRPV